MTDPHPPITLADRLALLWDLVRRPNGKPFSNADVAAALGRSPAYIAALRDGTRRHPHADLIATLARFFDVPIAYFFDDDLYRRVAAQRDLATALADHHLHLAALRDVTDALTDRPLTTEQYRHLTNLINNLSHP